MSAHVNKIKSEYLTAEELADIFRLKNHRTIHNWVYSGEFREKEYIKMKGILLFNWPAIRDRLHSEKSSTIAKSKTQQANRPNGCLINL